MSENKFMARLRGEKAVKSVLEIKKYGEDHPFANMPNGSSDTTVGTDTQINHGISYVRGTQVWKIDGNAMSVADNNYTGSGADKTGEVEVGGQGLWVDSTYVFPNNLTEDTLAAVITSHPKFVVNLFGDNLFNASNTQMDFTVLLKLGSKNLVAKSFSVMPQANFFHKQFEIGFDESIDDNTYFEQGALLTLQIICADPTATARIYTGMSNLILMNRKIDTNLVSPDFQDFDEWVYHVKEMDKKINNIIVKTDTMPEASTVELGSVYVYMGETNPVYTHGYVYQNIIQEDNVMTFSDDSISCNWNKLSAFLAQHTAEYNNIAKGTMEYIPEANLWKIIFNGADDSVIFHYQQYSGDWEEAGFVFSKEFTSQVTVSFTRTTTQTRIWERMDVQPGAKWGNIVGDLLDQTDLKEALDSKQDKLTAGENITIDENNVISASGNVESVNGKTGIVVLTGEDISADVSELTDTVQGHLQTLHDNIKDIELFKFPNATIIGEPVIQNGQVSGFTANDYLQFPFIVDLHNQPFVIDFCFTTGDDVTTQQNILDSQFGLALAIANGKGLMAISHNGTSWAGAITGTMTINPNTTYYARLSWNRINYQTQLSTDGTTYTPDMNFGSTQSPYPRTMFIGGCSGSAIGHTPHPFKGTINMNYAYLTVAGNVIWQGMDDAGLATRMASDVSNITEEGKERIKQIVGSVASDSIQDQNPLEGVDKIWSGTPEQLPEEKANDTFYATFEAGKTPVPYRISVAERNIGETIFSLVPLMDSGLHLLDGDNIDGTGVYAQFYQKMVELQSVAPQCFVSEEDWQAEVSAHGVCGKFVLDTASQTVRLPKLKNGILTDNAVVGNGMTVGLTDGTNNTGMSLTSGSGSVANYSQYYGTNVGTTGGSSGITGAKSIGITTDGTKSGIVVDSATQGYYYIVLANTIKQPIEADVDQILEQVNTYTSRIEDMESHKVIEFQIPTEENGYTWYRLYADGWVEQGGIIPTQTAATITINIPVEMVDSNWYFSTSGSNSSTSDTINFAQFSAWDRTTTAFKTRSSSTGAKNWQVSGMVK